MTCAPPFEKMETSRRRFLGALAAGLAVRPAIRLAPDVDWVALTVNGRPVYDCPSYFFVNAFGIYELTPEDKVRIIGRPLVQLGQPSEPRPAI